MRRLASAGLAIAVFIGSRTAAQNPPAARPIASIRIQPESLALDIGDSVRVSATAIDSAGRPVDVPFVYYSTSRRALEIRPGGWARALAAGSFRILAIPVAQGQPNTAQRGEAPVTVRWPPIRSVRVTRIPERIYAGTSVRLGLEMIDAASQQRTNVEPAWHSSDQNVAQVDRYGVILAHRAGPVTLSVTAAGVTGEQRLTILASPATSLELTASAAGGRTGDVIHFRAVPKDASGQPISDMPVTYAVKADVEDTVIAPEAAAEVDDRGRFVAQRAGSYTVVATAGNVVARRSVTVLHRYTSARLNAGKGQGAVHDKYTSDIWVWTGKDGRDYAVTGTWGSDGTAYFWDVTDPASPALADSVQVDARTVNDVKVDVERELCFITREGASNRRNGFVILDCSNPRDVQIVSTFDDGLYGGVHNIFYWNKRLFPINAGTRFDIINIEDPRRPFREGFFELDTPGHSIHDVWVVDGIAYASQWEDGMIMVDVGNGKYGGTPAKPVFISSYKYPIGGTHSAFPYFSRSANRFYVFIGDEEFPYEARPGEPEEPGGYIHIVDFTDVKKPEEVARYQIPEAGPHNFWVENDTLYVAYYNAGLRIVDVSGELKGNLYYQGRELARFEAFDPGGKVANAPMAWGPQPHKGHVFFSDHHSGLWSVKLPERTRIVP